eukprot:2695854-Pyramimonas_sp.AAC.1
MAGLAPVGMALDGMAKLIPVKLALGSRRSCGTLRARGLGVLARGRADCEIERGSVQGTGPCVRSVFWQH